MEYTIEQLDEKLNRLIEILCVEQDVDIAKFDLANMELSDKRLVFRGLSNQRRPFPLTSEFMRLQDEILSYEREHKQIVEVNKLAYSKNMCIFRVI